MDKKERQEQMHHHARRFLTTQTLAAARFCSVRNDNGYVKKGGKMEKRPRL